MSALPSTVTVRRRWLTALAVVLITLVGVVLLTLFWSAWRGQRLVLEPTSAPSALNIIPTLAYGECLNEWQPNGTAPDVSARARQYLAEAGVPDRMDVRSVTVGLAVGEGEDCLNPQTLLIDHFWAYLVTLPIFIAVDAETLADDAALGDITAAAIFALRDAGIPNADSTLVFTFSAGEGAERVTRALRVKRGVGEGLVADGLRGGALWAALEGSAR